MAWDNVDGAKDDDCQVGLRERGRGRGRGRGKLREREHIRL